MLGDVGGVKVMMHALSQLASLCCPVSGQIFEVRGLTVFGLVLPNEAALDEIEDSCLFGTSNA